jgi:di/tricarboxylate transporter
MIEADRVKRIQDPWGVMTAMVPEAWVTLGLVGVVLALLLGTRWPADMVMLGGLTMTLVVPVPQNGTWRFGVLSASDALIGFSNEGMITVAALFVVAHGLRDTGAIAMVSEHLLGRPKSLRGGLLRMMVPAGMASAFLNNTPIIAILMPAVLDWAKKHQLAASHLLIPLSYATILGGTCTLIGTSTNLVVHGLLVSEMRLPGLGMFDLCWVGIPVAIVGFAFLVVAAPWLLPDRRPPISELDDPRQYTLDMLVEPNSPLVGRTIEEAGLRHLPGAFLMEIERGTEVIVAVPPNEVLQANDRLVFVGVVDSVVDLQKVRGLVPATNQVFKLDSPRPRRCLIEAVVSDSCPVVGRTIREGRFRTRYTAVVIAVARNGVRLSGKIGDIRLRAGDTLLLEASPEFVDRQRNNRDFYLVSPIQGSWPLHYERAPLAMAILAGMVVTVSLGWFSMLQSALMASMLMILTRCCTAAGARRSIDWSILMVIAAAFGLGRALQVSQAAETVAGYLMNLVGNHELAVLAAVYLATLVTTAFITNNAAAVLMFPIAMAAAQRIDAQPMPFAIIVIMAASAGFATPIGYQTNLMVYGPGGYRFTDFARIGLPLTLLVGVVTLALVPQIWPL